MKHLVLMTLTLTSMFFSLNASAAVADKNAWEKVCDQGVLAACTKAATLLEDKLVQASEVSEEKALRERLVNVSRIACNKSDLAACNQLYLNTDSASKDAELAKEVSARQCTQGNARACEQSERLTETEISTHELVQSDLTLEFQLASK